METLLTYSIGGIICFVFLVIYLKSLKKREARAREAAEKGKLYSHGPQAQHPHIDNNYCIGCATCTAVCGDGLVCGGETCEADADCAAGTVCQGCQCVKPPVCASGMECDDGICKPHGG